MLLQTPEACHRICLCWPRFLRGLAEAAASTFQAETCPAGNQLAVLKISSRYHEVVQCGGDPLAIAARLIGKLFAMLIQKSLAISVIRPEV